MTWPFRRREWSYLGHTVVRGRETSLLTGTSAVEIAVHFYESEGRRKVVCDRYRGECKKLPIISAWLRGGDVDPIERKRA